MSTANGKDDVIRPLHISRIALLISLAGGAQALGECPSPGVFELSSLDGTNGFILRGVDAEDRSGVSVSRTGDVNGDGIDDIVIGAWRASPNGDSGGASYIVFGGAGVGSAGVLELSSLDGTDGFVLNGVDADDMSGFSVSSAGDVNGDGVDDLIIGADRADPNGGASGESYVVFGGAGVGSTGAIELASLDGSDGFVLNGIAAGDRSGISVATAGDVNGDGVDDLIIAANGAYPGGESYVVFGGDGIGASGAFELSSLDGTNGFALNGVDIDSGSANAVSAAGDVNGDGVHDLVIGADRDDPNGDSSGAIYVVFGGVAVGSAGAIELASLDGSNGFVLNGIDAGDRSGSSVSTAGDVNADGLDDIIIGARAADPNGSNSGECYVVFGGASVGSTGVLELSSLDGTNGFVLNGIHENDSSGVSVSSAGDVNGDGVADVIIGAWGGDANGDSSGESYVVFGGAGVGSTGSVELSSLDGTNGFILNGVDAGDRSARSVSGAGDVNQDGFDDVIIGGEFADPNGPSSGESYVVFGGEPAPPDPADFNADGCVDSADLATLLASWGGPGADIDGDGVAGGTDLAILLAAWTAH